METGASNDKGVLTEIYISLDPSLKKQLLKTAKIIAETQSTLLEELRDEDER